MRKGSATPAPVKRARTRGDGSHLLPEYTRRSACRATCHSQGVPEAIEEGGVLALPSRWESGDTDARTGIGNEGTAMKLALIGLRGTGKSTVGYLLAQRLSWKFLDTDMLVQDRADTTIREIFEKFGEAHFRKIESEVVQECAAHDQAIIATGGGAVMNPVNVAALRQNGFVVHLSASPDELWRRISGDPASLAKRPKLVADADSGLDELRKLMLSRAAAYAQARDAEVCVEHRTPDEVADAVNLLMRTYGIIP